MIDHTSRRILILGCAGAGKSTLAAALGARLHLPVIHLDSAYWNAGWKETPTADWRTKVAALIQGEKWIVDGNYFPTLDLRLAACDTAVFLDLGRLTCLRRVLVRWMKYRGRSRPNMPAGCPEMIDAEFISWIWNFPSRDRSSTLAALAAVAQDKRILILRSSSEVKALLAEL